jgi:5-(carboxyamino)imidazole ribonucleotide synthase
MYEGLTESMAIDGVKIHLYGKKITKPYRKMGHVTVMSSSLECALKKPEKVKQLIKVNHGKKASKHSNGIRFRFACNETGSRNA